jgi:iron complex transport system substrate-binding protein
MKWLTIVVLVLMAVLGGSWLYHGWIVPPKNSSSAVYAALKDAPAPAAPVGSFPSGPAKDLKRIICTDGALTEIVYALGFGENVVAADSTALWPDSVKKKPSIGYVRKISAEGVLSLSPTLILNNQEAGPPEAVDQLRKSGVQVYDIPGERQNRAFPVVLKRITHVAEALGVPEKGAELVKVVQADLDAVRKAVEGKKKPKALFLFNPTVEKLTAGGLNTGAHEFMTLCGLDNVASSLDGWKPLSQEAIAAAAPEVLISSARSHQNFDTAEELLKVHGLGQTPAGKAKRVIYVDSGKFLSGGPRAGEMAIEFLKLLYPDMAVPESQSTVWFKKIEEKFRD